MILILTLEKILLKTFIENTINYIIIALTTRFYDTYPDINDNVKMNK